MTAPAMMPPALRERELRTHTTCSLCRQKIGHTGLPLFWRVRIDRFGLDGYALQRLTGLTALLGGHAVLASVMGPDEELAKPVMETVTLTVCEQCAVLSNLPIAGLVEVAADREATVPNEDGRPDASR